MAGTSPIRLGSANGTYLVFESSSNVTTSDSGIQSCSVKALWGDGSTIFTKIPVAGTSFTTVFGTAYLPADFKVDYTGGGADIEYLDGRCARVTFNFKRPDPNASGPAASRQVFVDSVFNYKSIFGTLGAPVVTASGDPSPGIRGFAEPTVTVKYNTTTPPAIGGGTLASVYALPGDPRALGFPAINQIDVPWKVIFTKAIIDQSGTGAITIYYFDGTTFQTLVITTPTTLNFNLPFTGNPLGWQLTKLKYDPVAGATTYDVEESWRNFYVFKGAQFLNLTHP